VKRWTEEELLEALLRFEQKHGRRPAWIDVAEHAKQFGLPHISVIQRIYGSWSNLCVELWGESVPQGGQNAKDEDTARVIASLNEGVTLAELARARGISGQALGRRVNRYQAAMGLPVIKRRPGAPRKDRFRVAA
jgi:hypothetical protein